MAGSGSGSPCGACKFLRRKCVDGCIFAPYFSHDHAPTLFSAIHKVFGASNASKLLANLPAAHRSHAALTIAYEAQARLHDPIYGCVSHIFALQQQVVHLQAQLAYLKEQAAQIGVLLDSYATRNPSDQTLHDLQTWFQTESLGTAADPNLMGSDGSNTDFAFTTYEEIFSSISSLDIQINDGVWTIRDAGDLLPAALASGQRFS